jgi:hypothetical protein
LQQERTTPGSTHHCAAAMVVTKRRDVRSPRSHSTCRPARIRGARCKGVSSVSTSRPQLEVHMGCLWPKFQPAPPPTPPPKHVPRALQRRSDLCPKARTRSGGPIPPPTHRPLHASTTHTRQLTQVHRARQRLLGHLQLPPPPRAVRLLLQLPHNIHYSGNKLRGHVWRELLGGFVAATAGPVNA